MCIASNSHSIEAWDNLHSLIPQSLKGGLSKMLQWIISEVDI